MAQSGNKTAVLSKVFPTRSIPFRPKEELLALLPARIQMTTGDGTCTTQSKALTILGTKTR